MLLNVDELASLDAALHHPAPRTSFVPPVNSLNRIKERRNITFNLA